MIRKMKLTRAKNGEWTVTGIDEKSFRFLVHSAENPSREGTRWAEHFSVGENTLNIVLGCGLGFHILALLKRMPSSSKIIIVIPPQEESWLKRLKEETPIEMLQSGNVSWLASQDPYDLGVVIATFMLENRLKKVRLCPYRPGMRIYADFYDSCNEGLAKQIEDTMSVLLNVRFLGGKLYLTNYLKNLSYIVLNPGVDQFLNLFSPNTPVIIVGSGPSLNKNIDILRRIQNDVVIIAAGSAMVALRRANITPHILAVVDPMEIMYEVLKDQFLEETLLIASSSVNHDVVANYPGNVLFFDGNDTPQWTALNRLLPKTRKLLQAASVSTIAVDFARICGSRKIILMGQDLSCSSWEKQHAEGVKTEGYRGEPTVVVPGYHGDSVLTYREMKLIIDFFVSYAENFPQVDYINATEGGACIRGMKQIPLEKIAEEICGSKWGVRTTNKIERKFSQRRKQKICVIIAEIREMEGKLGKYAELLKSTSDSLINIAETDVIKKCSNVLEGKMAEDVSEVLEHILQPRLQTIEFYRQEDATIEEIVVMYKNVLEDMQSFCLYTAAILKDAAGKIEGASIHGS